METIKTIYRIGRGPSSSHTMGPAKAADIFKNKNKEAVKFIVTLYGSLAATGKGHMTDKAVIDSLSPFSAEIIWKPDIFLPRHPNGMNFKSFSSSGNLIEEWNAYSVGGGSIVDDNTEIETEHVYNRNTMDEILTWCTLSGKTFWEYIEEHEGTQIWSYLEKVWKQMQQTIKNGLSGDGVLPGCLGLSRKASRYQIKANDYTGSIKWRNLLFSYALASSEENASGNIVVTAPTCGSCGIVPAVLYYLKKKHKVDDNRILKGLATAGLIGTLIRNNASISGAEVGCQGEVGSACAMAAAAFVQVIGGYPSQIEYAAEIGMEHNLGLTCDPVAGLVQVPCIERNAFAASRAIDAGTYAGFSDGTHRISFDKVIQTMKETGLNLNCIYKETSLGGLATAYGIKK